MRSDPVAEQSLQAICQEVYQATRVDPKRSLHLARIAIELARSSSEPGDLGLAARSLGHAWRAAADYRRALAAYAASDRAFERSGDAVERARNAIGKLDALMYLGRYEEALTEASRAERVFLDAGEEVRLATLRVNLGSLYFRLDRYPEAAATYERSLPVLEAQGNLDTLASVRFNLATVQTSLLRFQEAEGLYEQAAEYFRASGMSVLEAMTDYNLACLEHMRGRYSTSLQRLERAVEVLGPAGDPGLLASCRLEQADLFLSLGMASESNRAAERAAASFAELGMRYEHAKSLSRQGVALALEGRFEPALEVLSRALGLFRDEGSRLWIALCRLHIAEVHRQAGRDAPAVALAREALQELGKTGDPRALGLGHLVLGSCDARNRRSLNEAVRLLRRAEAAGPEAEATARLARSLYRRGRRRAALRCLRLAIERAETMRARMTEGSLRRHFHSTKADLYGRVALLLGEDTGQAGALEALAWLERGRARSLVELIEDRDFRGGRVDAGAADAEPERKARQELNLMYRRIDAQGWSGEHVAEQARLRDRIRALELELAEREIHRRLAAPEAHSAGSDSIAGPGTAHGGPEALRLAPDWLVLETFQVDGVLGAVALRGGRARLLPELATVAEVDALLRQVQLGLAGAVADASATAGESRTLGLGMVERELGRLHDLLVRPAESAVGSGRHLLVIPAGVVSYVPFAALCDVHGRVLAEHMSVSMSPSLESHRRFVALGERDNLVAEAPALVLGHGPGLPGVERELNAVASALGPSVRRLSGAAASCAALLEHAPQARVLHLACHGVFRRDHPLFSSLVLADGRLSFYDLFRLQLRAHLVVLSACETARSELGPGEELMGLAGGLLLAGARAVVVSLWEVLDESSAAFMERFYAQLAGGVPAAQALAAAMVEVRALRPHPVHWAPYVLLGDPDVRIA
jgi:tetratricopeptide (TPR) repeat protein